jgi:hypothetical protein
VEAPTHEIDNPPKLAYIRKALEIEAENARKMVGIALFKMKICNLFRKIIRVLSF